MDLESNKIKKKAQEDTDAAAFLQT